MWQDIIITIANITFSVSLLPQIYYGLKEKRGVIKYQTSIPTFLGLYGISFAYLTLSLYASAAITFVTGTLWFILFIQKMIYKK